MRLSINNITIDPAVDIRQKMDETTIKEYMEVLDRMPPVVVFDTPEGYILSDGFHRTTAAERLGRTEIEAEIRRGTRQDAEEYAAHANAHAALKLTSAERAVGIRRVHRIHPDWSRERIGDLMGCSRKTVDDIISSLQVKREVPTAVGLSDSTAAEIARAPREHWEPLTRATVQKDWTGEEVAQAVRNIKDPSIPIEHKQALLEGTTEPVARINGEPALLPQTVRRHLVQEAGRDYLSFIESMLYNLAQLRRFSAEEVITGLEMQRLAAFVRGLPGDIEYLNELLRLGRQRLEL